MRNRFTIKCNVCGKDASTVILTVITNLKSEEKSTAQIEISCNCGNKEVLSGKHKGRES